MGFGGGGGGGVGETGIASDWLSCIRSMVGGAGLNGCPDKFKTTIGLMIVSASRIRTVPFIKTFVVIIRGFFVTKLKA